MFRGPHLYSMTPMVRIRIGLDSAAADDLEHLALHHDRRVFINADAPDPWRHRSDDTARALPSSPRVDAAGVTHSNIAKVNLMPPFPSMILRVHVLSSGDAFDLAMRRPVGVP